jgi:hypothetical protein
MIIEFNSYFDIFLHKQESKNILLPRKQALYRYPRPVCESWFSKENARSKDATKTQIHVLKLDIQIYIYLSMKCWHTSASCDVYSDLTTNACSGSIGRWTVIDSRVRRHEHPNGQTGGKGRAPTVMGWPSDCQVRGHTINVLPPYNRGQGRIRGHRAFQCDILSHTYVIFGLSQGDGGAI